METTLRHVGLDVHKLDTVIAVADGIREPQVHSRVSSDNASMERVLKTLDGPGRVRVCYKKSGCTLRPERTARSTAGREFRNKMFSRVDSPAPQFDKQCSRSRPFTIPVLESAMFRVMLCVTFAVLSASGRGDDAPAKKAATPTNAQFETMKKLAGTWVEADKDGKPTDKVVSVIKLTAAGTVLHETTFPGQPMEMISVYHVDKGDLFMTHYCAIGNQPKMKADPKSKKGTIRFDFAGGTNLDPAKDMHMHAATLTFVDDDHVQLAGEAWVDGKPAEAHCGTMSLVRKK
jgi:hypothetical protein